MDCWQLDGTRALLNLEGLRGMVDLARPMRGLSALIVNEAAVEGGLLGVSVEPDAGVAERGDVLWQPADAYVRGADLVVAYREPLEVAYNVQIYWRLVPATKTVLFAIDAIVSVQTPLWEAHPAVTVRSELFGRPATPVGAGLTIRGDNGWSYVEATRPGDFIVATQNEQGVDSPGGGWRFGRQFMEKGVIRRLQLRGAIVSHGAEEASADQLRVALSGEEPQLTT